jgi:hypothetical protein
MVLPTLKMPRREAFRLLRGKNKERVTKPKGAISSKEKQKAAEEE